MTRKADLGVLILNGAPTPGMVEEANHAGTYEHPATGTVYPRIQIITTTGELLLGKQPNLPGTMNPYLRAQRSTVAADKASCSGRETSGAFRKPVRKRFRRCLLSTGLCDLHHGSFARLEPRETLGNIMNRCSRDEGPAVHRTSTGVSTDF